MFLVTNAGKFFQIDEQDIQVLARYPYICIGSDGYVLVGKSFLDTKYRLHRLLLNCPKNLVVDHINHDRLDYRRSNLRICTHSENNQNIRKTKKENHTSQYKGVRWHKRDKKWEARIQLNKKQIFLGQFTSEILAAERYDDAAEHFFKQFAHLNFPMRQTGPFRMQQPLKRHSKYRGISFDKTRKSNPWTACVQNKGTRWQERFPTEQEALQALEQKKIELLSGV